MGDLVFDDFFNMELDRIPVFFRVNDKLKKVFIILLAVFTVTEFILLAIIPHTQEVHGFLKVTYSSTLWTAICIVFAIILFILFWIVICIQYEKTAYKKASKSFRDYDFYRKEKIREANSELKRMNNTF
ncbi:MAG: hypothetical protein MJ172_05020 [Clostridia bacterium]|nr:hypothetical protein [Clostridia bacterium]